MGAKYLPTVKDQKAALRFHQKQASKVKAAPSPADLPAKKSKQK